MLSADYSTSQSVYIAYRLDGAIKIGRSVNPKIRTRGIRYESLQNWSVQLLDSFPHVFASVVERVAHFLLAPYRITGEWFATSLRRARAAVRAAIQAVNATMFAPDGTAQIKRQGDAQRAFHYAKGTAASNRARARVRESDDAE